MLIFAKIHENDSVKEFYSLRNFFDYLAMNGFLMKTTTGEELKKGKPMKYFIV